MFNSKVGTKNLLSSLLINEVKKRPPLYDYCSPLYRNKVLRRKLWDEVCRAVVPDYYELKNVEKYVKVKELQTRWKSLRDYYRATITGKSRQSARKSKTPYIYAEELDFLFPFICPENENPENVAHRNDCGNNLVNFNNDYSRDDYDEEMNTAFEHSDENMSSGDNSNSSKMFKRINQQAHSNLDHLIESSGGAIEIIDDDPDWEIPVENIKKESVKRRRKRMSKFENSLLKVIKNNFKETKNDGDKEFLLSLLPNIKQLSDYDKIELRSEFLNVLKSKMKKDNAS